MSDKLLSLVKISILLAICFSGKSLFAEDFYKGKVIRFVVGYSAGGGYDTYTRAIARHIGKHIPGNPSHIVVNMSGAGSLIAANHLYNKAKPDGLTVGVWASGLILRQALGDKSVKFDGRKLGWIGAPSQSLPACGIMGFTGLKTIDDVLAAKKRITLAGIRLGSNTVDFPTVLNKTLGTNFKIIPGYKGTSKVRLAMQALEVDGGCFAWDSMKSTARAMLDAKGDDKLIPFIISKRSKDPELKNVPAVLDMIKDKKKLAIFNSWFAFNDFFRPFTVPPGTPAERLDTLRKAFADTMKDREFLEEAKKSRLTIVYVPSQEIERNVDQILSMTPDVKRNLAFLVRKKKKK